MSQTGHHRHTADFDHAKPSTDQRPQQRLGGVGGDRPEFASLAGTGTIHRSRWEGGRGHDLGQGQRRLPTAWPQLQDSLCAIDLPLRRPHTGET